MIFKIKSIRVHTILIVAFTGLISLFFVFRATPDDAELGFYVIVGQSNASGRGERILLSKKQILWADQNIHIFGNDGKLRIGGLPVDREAEDAPQNALYDEQRHTGIGPAFGIANEFARHYFPAIRAANVGFVPCTKGGLGLAHFLPRDVDGSAGGDIFDLCKQRIDAVKSIGKIKGLVIYIGEADAFDIKRITSWEKNFIHLVENYRAAVGNKDLPVVLVGIGDVTEYWLNITKLDDRWWSVLQRVQAEIEMPNLYHVSAQGKELKTDGIHLSTNGQLALGHEIGDAFIQHELREYLSRFY